MMDLTVGGPRSLRRSSSGCATVTCARSRSRENYFGVVVRKEKRHGGLSESYTNRQNAHQEQGL